MKFGLVPVILLIVSSFLLVNTNIKSTGGISFDSTTYPVGTSEYTLNTTDYEGVKYLCFPDNFEPRGLACDGNGRVWACLYGTQSLACIDPVTERATIYGNLPVSPWTIAVDGANDVWINSKGARYLARLDVDASSCTVYWLTDGIYQYGTRDVTYHEGFIWYSGIHFLLKMNCTTAEGELYTTGFGSDGYMIGDHDCLWITYSSEGAVQRFNMTSGVFDKQIWGFERPCGIDVDNGYVYVAEKIERVPILMAVDDISAGQNCAVGTVFCTCVLGRIPKIGDKVWLNDTAEEAENPHSEYNSVQSIVGISGKRVILQFTNPFAYDHPKASYTVLYVVEPVARINKKDFSVNRIHTAGIMHYMNITEPVDGICTVLKDSCGNLWWGDSCMHVGYVSIYAGNKATDSIGRHCYSIIEVPAVNNTSKTVWFSCVGSANVGIATLPGGSFKRTRSGVLVLAD